MWSEPFPFCFAYLNTWQMFWPVSVEKEMFWPWLFCILTLRWECQGRDICEPGETRGWNGRVRVHQAVHWPSAWPVKHGVICGSHIWITQWVLNPKLSIISVLYHASPLRSSWESCFNGEHKCSVKHYYLSFRPTSHWLLVSQFVFRYRCWAACMRLSSLSQKWFVMFLRSVRSQLVLLWTSNGDPTQYFKGSRNPLFQHQPVLTTVVKKAMAICTKTAAFSLQ